MKQSFLFLLTFLLAFSVSAQIFKKDDIVEVDPSKSDTLVANWKHATVISFDSAANNYVVRLPDGNNFTIPSKNPEKWIRPVVNKQVLNKYGPGAHITYEKREIAMKAFKCNPSEAGIKKNIKSQMASFYKDYPWISVDFTSFKGQQGYDSKKYKGQFVYPYKIEMLVHLKRTLIMGGKQFTEYQTWEFDREYEYVTRPGKNCDFYAAQANDAKLVSKGWY